LGIQSQAPGGGSERPTAEWARKVISRIGKAACVVVDPGNSRTGKPVKFATAHDLRRSCAQRLRDANVPPLVIQAIMRHASWETTVRHYAPGDVQESAKALRKYLGTPASEGSREEPAESMQTAVD
jgi:integrase